MDPPSFPYGPENVLSGVTRPESYSNVWISDTKGSWPHWLELDFKKDIAFNTIQSVFDSNLDRQMDEGGKMIAGPIPEIVKRFSVEVWAGGKWKTVLSVADNHQRFRRDSFKRVQSSKLKIVVEEAYTDGYDELRDQRPLVGPQSAHPLLSPDAIPTARVFEVRLYDE